MTELQKESLFRRIRGLGIQVPCKGFLAAIDTLDEGRNGKYSDDPVKWRKLPAEHHLEHMVTHLELLQAGDTSENHAAHMVTRALMAYEKMLEV